MKDLNIEFSKVGLEFMDDGDFMEIWNGDKFVTRFSSSYEAACEVLKPYQNDKLESHISCQKEFEKRNEISSNFTKAAVINEIGVIVGLCKTNTNAVNVAGAFDRDGSPVNITKMKVSRSKDNLQSAEKLSMFFSWMEHNDDIFYYVVK